MEKTTQNFGERDLDSERGKEEKVREAGNPSFRG